MEKELGFAHFLAQVDGVGISVLVLLLAKMKALLMTS